MFLSCTNRNLGQQCCYNDDGDYITMNKPAGSADFMFPTKFYFPHQSADYYPYKVCCIDSDDPASCQNYYDKRPKDNGTNCGSAESGRGRFML